MQEATHFLRDPVTVALARPRDIEDLNSGLGQPLPDRAVHRIHIASSVSGEIDVQKRTKVTVGQGSSEGASTVRWPARDEERAVGLEDIALGPLRVVAAGHLDHPVAIRHTAVFRASPGRAVTAVLEAEIDRGVEGAAIGAGLPARDDLVHAPSVLARATASGR